MIKIALWFLILFILSTGTGIEIKKRLQVNLKGFSAPIGFAVLLCLLQVFYYPIQWFTLSFKLIKVFTILVLGLSTLCTLKNIKELIKEFLTLKIIPVGLSLLAFLFILYKCFANLDFSDSVTYLNYIYQNINLPHINTFDPTNGLMGKEWDTLYLFQGYYHFSSFSSWVINLPYYLGKSYYQISTITIMIWGFGAFFNLLSSTFIMNLTDELPTDNKYIKYTLCFLALGYLNFYYWKIPFAFYGNTYRGLFITLLIYVIYQSIKTNEKGMKVLIPIITAAGIAVSSSFLFMGFAILYAYAAYLFLTKKENGLKEMMYCIIPLVIYAACYFGKVIPVFCYGVIGIYTLIIILTVTKVLDKLISIMENFFQKYTIPLLFIFVPAVFALYSLYINITDPEYLVGYADYFKDYQSIDMVKDYFFVYSHTTDNILNLARWVGLGFFCYKAKNTEDKYIKVLILVLATFLLNPLCISALSKTITGMVYYRNFEVLFNPFTELLFITYLLNECIEHKYNTLAYAIAGIIALCVPAGHILSFTSNTGLYSFYRQGAASVNPITKVDNDEQYAIEFLRDYIKENGVQENTKAIDRDDDFYAIEQPIIISHSSAVLSQIPGIYQVFTPRETYYTGNRVDWNFYEITRPHYDWLKTEVEVPYENTCMYLERYDVDYLLIQYWQNEEFDKASDGCSVTLLTGAKYKVKAVDKDFEFWSEE